MLVAKYYIFCHVKSLKYTICLLKSILKLEVIEFLYYSPYLTNENLKKPDLVMSPLWLTKMVGEIQCLAGISFTMELLF